MAAGFSASNGAAAAATGRPTKATYEKTLFPPREKRVSVNRPRQSAAGLNQTEKELPQPQVVVAWGLRITNWAPLTSSL